MKTRSAKTLSLTHKELERTKENLKERRAGLWLEIMPYAVRCLGCQERLEKSNP